MANTNFIASANLFGWGNSFNATGKFPVIAKRIWATYDDMYAFVADTSDVCTSGVVLTVINDSDASKNGAYFVASCPTLENPDIEVKVEKIGASDELVASLNVKDVDTTASNGVALTLSEGVVGVTVTPADLAASLVGTAESVGGVSGLSVRLGEAITSTETGEDGEEVTEEVIGATATVKDAIQTLAGQIQAAVAGGITSISGDSNYIKVGGTTTAKSLSLNMANVGKALIADDETILKVTADDTANTAKLSVNMVELGKAIVAENGGITVNEETGELSIEWTEIE